MVAGDFLNGLPNGPTAIQVGKPNETQIQGYRFACVVDFELGRLGGKLMCNQWGSNYSPGSTKFVQFISEPASLSFVESNGMVELVGKNMRMESAWGQKLAGGTEISFSQDNVDVSIKYTNKLNNPKTELTTSMFNTTVISWQKGRPVGSVAGRFMFENSGSRWSAGLADTRALSLDYVSSKEFRGGSGESAARQFREKLYKISFYGRDFDVIFFKKPLFSDSSNSFDEIDMEVLYLKDGAIEFDAGRYEACDSKTGGASMVYRHWTWTNSRPSQNFQPVTFLPKCGYLRDVKNGKEYFGNFDKNGKPLGRF